MIETLTDNNAILLLYLAGELPEADRLEVDRRLAADPNLAEQLAELNGIHQRIGSGIAALDEADQGRFSPDSAINTAVATIEGWRFGPRLVIPQTAPQKHRVWSWAAPASLAASILIAATIWMAHRTANERVDHPFVLGPTTDKSNVVPALNDSDDNFALLRQSFSTGFEQGPRRAAPDGRPEVASRDDLSDYLLKTEVGQQ